jgi:hypothetical protein
MQATCFTVCLTFCVFGFVNWISGDKFTESGCDHPACRFDSFGFRFKLISEKYGARYVNGNVSLLGVGDVISS